MALDVPAGVYEIPEDAPEHGEVDVIVNYTNWCSAVRSPPRADGSRPPRGPTARSTRFSERARSAQSTDRLRTCARSGC